MARKPSEEQITRYADMFSAIGTEPNFRLSYLSSLLPAIFKKQKPRLTLTHSESSALGSSQRKS